MHARHGSMTMALDVVDLVPGLSCLGTQPYMHFFGTFLQNGDLGGSIEGLALVFVGFSARWLRIGLAWHYWLCNYNTCF